MNVNSAIRVDERAEAKALTPQLAVPTLLLSAGVLTFHLLVLAAALIGPFPLPVAGLLLGLSAYAHYTLVHESVHGNVARKHRWLHDVLGWQGSLVLGVTWPLLRRTHQLHHSHTNDEDDPDSFVHGSWPRLAAISLVLSVALLVPWTLLKRVLPRWPAFRYVFMGEHMTAAERRTNEAVQAAMAAATVLGLLLAPWATLWLWVVPGLIGRTLLMTLFQWWPHRPFTNNTRYGATRYGFLGAEPLWLSQNLHLVHHLWPSVPWYNYGRLRRRLAPVLAEKGAVHRDWPWRTAPVAQ